MMTPQDFASKIRAKYPGAYDSVDDNTLTQKILTKYPEYSDVVSASSQDPGVLKSAAAGAMSGIPLAETATAGIESVVNNTPYEQEHNSLEDLKNQAWDKHPIAYGGGKAAGMIGTGLVAPEGIPGAIAVGAASGLDEAKNLSEVPSDVTKGAAVGGVLGTIGEKVISPLIENGVPAAAKRAVASLIPGNKNISALDAVESRLANPEAIDSSLSPANAADKLEGFSQNIKTAIGHLSDQAKDTLSPSSVVDMNEISPLLDAAKKSFLTDGVAAGDAQNAAVNTLSKWEESLGQIAAKNNGAIPDTTLAELIRDIRANTNYNPMTATAQSNMSDNALKGLSHDLDDILKTKNDAYKQAMEPVAELAGLSDKVARTFALKKVPGEGIQATDTTSGKLSNILNENKTNAQDVLSQLGGLTGYDFLGNAKNYATKEAFENAGASSDLKNLFTMLGYGAGHMTGIPGAGIVGAGVGRISAAHIDGGAIAANLIDKYLNIKTVSADAGVTDALKTFGPVLVKAAKAGGNQLAATHFVLATSNPQYQDLIQKTQQ